MSVADALFSLVKITQLAINSDAKQLLAQLRGDGDEGDDDTAEPEDDAPYFPQFGVAIRPVLQDTLRGLAARFGDEMWLLKLWDRAKQPTDLDEGETRLYSVGEKDARVRLLGDGAVEIRSKSQKSIKLIVNSAEISIGNDGQVTILSASDQPLNISSQGSGAINVTPQGSGDIVLNSGNLKVARVTDSTTGHNHTASFTLTDSMSGAVSGSITINSNTDTISSSAGASRVKA